MQEMYFCPVFFSTNWKRLCNSYIGQTLPKDELMECQGEKCWINQTNNKNTNVEEICTTNCAYVRKKNWQEVTSFQLFNFECKHTSIHLDLPISCLSRLWLRLQTHTHSTHTLSPPPCTAVMFWLTLQTWLKLLQQSHRLTCLSVCLSHTYCSPSIAKRS